MLTTKTVILILLVFASSMESGSSPPDYGSHEKFVEEVNKLRSKFAKEHNIPNMYKLYWSEDLAHPKTALSGYRIVQSHETYQNIIKHMLTNYDKFASGNDLDEVIYDKDPSHRVYYLIELLNPLQKFIGCHPSPPRASSEWTLWCMIGSAKTINFWYAKPKGAPASQCPNRFKAENNLCVPVDPSKHTFWGTSENMVEDLNYMRRKYAKDYGIPDMHQLSWDQSLADRLKPVDLYMETDFVTVRHHYSDRKNPKFFDDYCKIWRYTELPTFSSASTMVDESIHRFMIFERERANGHGQDRLFLNLIDDHSGAELVHPLQTAIGCMRKLMHYEIGNGTEMVICLMGKKGLWPENYKITVNSTKVPGSECMDGYMNNDGLCVFDKKRQEQIEKEAAEASFSTKMSYGLWTLGLIVFAF